MRNKQRLKANLQWQIPREQAEFDHDRGTRTNIKSSPNHRKTFIKPLYLYFVGCDKAFDSITWNGLWAIQKDMGPPDPHSRLTQNIYVTSKAAVRINNQISNTCKIENGVRQFCSTSMGNILSLTCAKQIIPSY